MSYELSNIINSIICADCFDVLKQLPDKSVDLILTDPPYGIGAGREKPHNGWADHGIRDWDTSKPSPEFFSEIIRVSKNQIVWGGNYFSEYLPSSMGWRIWDKGQRDFSLADGELAWTSFNSALRIFSYSRAAALQEGKIHPTQKPVPLFKWCLRDLSKPGDLILDPMCGSGTTALACHALGRRYICIDKESDYVEAARNRLLQFQAQGDLFAGENSALVEENQTNIQQSLYAAGEASVQQLKAEIAAIATEFDRIGPGSCGGEHLKSFYNLVIKLRQLSAV